MKNTSSQASRRLQDTPTLHLGCAPNPQLSQARFQSSLVQCPGSGSSDLRPPPLQRQSLPHAGVAVWPWEPVLARLSADIPQRAEMRWRWGGTWFGKLASVGSQRFRALLLPGNCHLSPLSSSLSLPGASVFPPEQFSKGQKTPPLLPYLLQSGLVASAWPRLMNTGFPEVGSVSRSSEITRPNHTPQGLLFPETVQKSLNYSEWPRKTWVLQYRSLGAFPFPPPTSWSKAWPPATREWQAG